MEIVKCGTEIYALQLVIKVIKKLLNRNEIEAEQWWTSSNSCTKWRLLNVTNEEYKSIQKQLKKEVGKLVKSVEFLTDYYGNEHPILYVCYDNLFSNDCKFDKVDDYSSLTIRI